MTVRVLFMTLNHDADWVQNEYSGARGSVFIIYGLIRIDDIVNRELYSFGLTFSHAWADLYWIFFRTTVLCISLSATLSVGVSLQVWKKIASK